MTSWGVEGGEVPRWLLALQSWEFLPHPHPLALCSPHLWHHVVWRGGREAQGGDGSGYEARWPAPFLGFSTGGHSASHPAPAGLLVLGWGLEKRNRLPRAGSARCAL